MKTLKFHPGPFHLSVLALSLAVGSACNASSSGSESASGDTGSESDTGEASGGTAASSSGATTDPDPDTDTDADPGTDADSDTAADSDTETETGEESSGSDFCPDYASMGLEELLTEAASGGLEIDGRLIEVELGVFDSFDSQVGIIGVVGQDILFVPISRQEVPTGEIIWLSGGSTYRGMGNVHVDLAAESMSVDLVTLDADSGDDSVTLRGCVMVGAGSSHFDVDGSTATVTGDLGSLTYLQVLRMQADLPAVDTLLLLDISGSINDEINVETGRLVRDAGWTTRVPANGEIASGGVDLFCGGAVRQVEDGGRLGVHSWSDGEMDGADYPPEHRAHASQLSYFSEMLGKTLGPDFYWFTLEAAPADGIHWMTDAELEQFQLVTP